MQKILLTFTLSICIFAGGILKTYAYETTAQHAFTLDGRTALFLIQFEFGHGDYEIHMPLRALAGDKETDSALSYIIYDDEGEEAEGVSTGIVLSSAPYKNGKYTIPRGRKMSFTLLVIYTPSDNEDQNHFRAEVNHLPFSFDGTTRLQLNPSELQYYTTDLLSLE